ncbi:hypothetical protein ACLF3G_27190 [Falsiroseomonas sp. HC035]|uniref:hypothetical protein n=1 Tax=Falsiroseomonas sp. HC035 TaxID=3390999 RepID=UPI003D32411C
MKNRLVAPRPGQIQIAEAADIPVTVDARAAAMIFDLRLMQLYALQGLALSTVEDRRRAFLLEELPYLDAARLRRNPHEQDQLLSHIEDAQLRQKLRDIWQDTYRHRQIAARPMEGELAAFDPTLDRGQALPYPLPDAWNDIEAGVVRGILDLPDGEDVLAGISMRTAELERSANADVRRAVAEGQAQFETNCYVVFDLIDGVPSEPRLLCEFERLLDPAPEPGWIPLSPAVRAHMAKADAIAFGRGTSGEVMETGRASTVAAGAVASTRRVAVGARGGRDIDLAPWTPSSKTELIVRAAVIGRDIHSSDRRWILHGVEVAAVVEEAMRKGTEDPILAAAVAMVGTLESAEGEDQIRRALDPEYAGSFLREVGWDSSYIRQGVCGLAGVLARATLFGREFPQRMEARSLVAADRIYRVSLLPRTGPSGVSNPGPQPITSQVEKGRFSAEGRRVAVREVAGDGSMGEEPAGAFVALLAQMPSLPPQERGARVARFQEELRLAQAGGVALVIRSEFEGAIAFVIRLADISKRVGGLPPSVEQVGAVAEAVIDQIRRTTIWRPEVALFVREAQREVVEALPLIAAAWSAAPRPSLVTEVLRLARAMGKSHVSRPPHS